MGKGASVCEPGATRRQQAPLSRRPHSPLPSLPWWRSLRSWRPVGTERRRVTSGRPRWGGHLGEPMAGVTLGSLWPRHLREPVVGGHLRKPPASPALGEPSAKPGPSTFFFFFFWVLRLAELCSSAWAGRENSAGFGSGRGQTPSNATSGHWRDAASPGAHRDGSRRAWPRPLPSAGGGSRGSRWLPRSRRARSRSCSPRGPQRQPDPRNGPRLLASVENPPSAPRPAPRTRTCRGRDRRGRSLSAWGRWALAAP